MKLGRKKAEQGEEFSQEGITTGRMKHRGVSVDIVALTPDALADRATSLALKTFSERVYQLTRMSKTPSSEEQYYIDQVKNEIAGAARLYQYLVDEGTITKEQFENDMGAKLRELGINI